MSEVISRVAKARVRTVSVHRESTISDHALLISVLVLGLFGAVMIASASMTYAQLTYSTPFFYVTRQVMFLAIGCFFAAVVFRIPLHLWEKYSAHLICASMLGLLLVLVPFIGKEVNGSRRWIDFGLFTVQVSETVKLFIIVYLASYLVRRGHLVQTTFGGFIRPLVLILIACVLLLLEPDFGAAVVIAGTATLMLFVAGVKFLQFVSLIGVLGVASTALILLSSYRLERLKSFLNPFADVYDTGYQLAASLIAISTGGINGLGFGNSIQKEHYLPEAHTDFLFAVLGEELGLIGILFTLGLYTFIVGRCFYLSKKADMQGNGFAGFLSLGIGIWIGLQSFINMGVSLGILPTKGITLPLMSYGGSSAVVFAITFGLLLRVEWELAQRDRVALRVGDSLKAAYP